jgi:hypothetical protein
MMSVTVDREELAAEQLGLETLGQVLTHVQRDNRLVVNLLIDGLAPDLASVENLRKSPLLGHTVYIETVEPRQMALDVLFEVDQQLADADRIRVEVIDLLQRNNPMKAMQRLSGCFSIWQHAQESVRKTAQLLRVDLSRLRVEKASLSEFLAEFCGHLRQIKSALEMRDFVTLSDTLTYELTRSTTGWVAALNAVRSVIG